MNSSEQEYSQWTNYDSLLQSYRSNMIASQSLLIAAAALFYEKSYLLVLITCTLGLFNQWYVWFRVIRSRFLISDLHKFNALYHFRDLVKEKINIELTEDRYVHDRKLRDAANQLLADEAGVPRLRSNWRLTRKKLDLVIPITFSIIWLFVLLSALVSFLYSLPSVSPSDRSGLLRLMMTWGNP